MPKTSKYADEKVSFTYVYPKKYKGPKPIVKQVKEIALIFGLNPNQALEFADNLPPLPDGSEGYFAIPSVDALAKIHFPEVIDPAEKYCRAVQFVHAKIAASRSFYNNYRGQITPAQLRVSDRTKRALNCIAKTQPGDIVIIAAQLGMGHRGESVRRAGVIFTDDEFGLGSLAVGSIILTNPRRLDNWKELDIICSGDESSTDFDNDFSYAPYFAFSKGKIVFKTLKVCYAGPFYSSASGFLPAVVDS
jgi:hypothetical protein